MSSTSKSLVVSQVIDHHETVDLFPEVMVYIEARRALVYLEYLLGYKPVHNRNGV